MAAVRLCEVAECVERLALSYPAAGADSTVTVAAAVGRRMLLLAGRAWFYAKEAANPAAEAEATGNSYANALAEQALADSRLSWWSLTTELKEVVAGNPTDQAEVIAAIRATVEAAIAESIRERRAAETVNGLLGDAPPPQGAVPYPQPETPTGWADLPRIVTSLKMPTDKVTMSRVSRALYRHTTKKDGKHKNGRPAYGDKIQSLARDVPSPGRGSRAEYFIAGVWPHLVALRQTNWKAIPATLLPTPAAC